ncbi:hypothetical protein K470DRAFT_92912 [Piedraia hortae CBS 480.64]|uniref:Uncharacterized protein n=1 Tax=Piedraia hortae CBS 480.64 TaxID=1314780 RepID=A0A6A7BYH0_9PEZI|nr:hypothetical protein K470DRAFT_92912 [Piedraia hortae CBS 480.64]
MISAILIVIITIFFPPVGVYLIAGCGADVCINICLCLLGYFPGHIHAFYLEYIYYSRREDAQQGIVSNRPAPGVYSDNVNTGGLQPMNPHHLPPQQQGYGTMPPQGY